MIAPPLSDGIATAAREAQSRNESWFCLVGVPILRPRSVRLPLRPKRPTQTGEEGMPTRDAWRSCTARACHVLIKLIHIVFGLCFLSSVALAACEDMEMRTDVQPTANGAPVDVKIGMVVADLMGVDDVGQQLDVDILFTTEWSDPRLEAYSGCRFQISEVWIPRLQLLNSSNLRLSFRNALNEVSVDPGGRVKHLQRATGHISSYHSLREFPFDSHEFKILIGTLAERQDNVNFVADPDNTWIANRLNIEGWDISGVSIKAEPGEIEATGQILSIATLSIHAARSPEFYVYRVMLLLIFVVGMSWVIFWVPPSRFEFQIGIGATSMLTAIAFNLALGGQLPPVGYLTTLDKMVIWAILLVFLSIIEALITGRLVLHGKEELALSIDRACRVLFPVLLAGGWTGMILLV